MISSSLQLIHPLLRLPIINVLFMSSWNRKHQIFLLLINILWKHMKNISISWKIKITVNPAVKSEFIEETCISLLLSPYNKKFIKIGISPLKSFIQEAKKSKYSNLIITTGIIHLIHIKIICWNFPLKF